MHVWDVSTGHLTAAAGCLAWEAVECREDAPAEPAGAEGPGSVHQGAALAEKAERDPKLV